MRDVTPREMLTSARYVPRDYRLRMRGDKDMSTVTAVVGMVSGEAVVWIDRIVGPDGAETPFTDLRAGRRNRLVSDLIAADNIVRSVGDTTCQHGRYLLEEFCIRCLAEAKATP